MGLLLTGNGPEAVEHYQSLITNGDNQILTGARQDLQAAINERGEIDRAGEALALLNEALDSA